MKCRYCKNKGVITLGLRKNNLYLFKQIYLCNRHFNELLKVKVPTYIPRIQRYDYKVNRYDKESK